MTIRDRYRQRVLRGLLGVALAVSLMSPVGAAGTATVSATSVLGATTQYRVTWISTAGGAVSSNAFAVVPGRILAVKFVPASGGTQPTNLYDATLVDADGVDVLDAAAANLSNATGRYFVFEPPLFFAGSVTAQTLDVVIANAGNAKGGTVYIWIENQR